MASQQPQQSEEPVSENSTPEAASSSGMLIFTGSIFE